MIVLDTHVLLWFDGGDVKLGPNTRSIIADGIARGEVVVSAISVWEVGMLVDKGSVNLHLSLSSWRREIFEQGLIEVPVSGDIAERAATLRNLHGDPADRIIFATALGGHRLVTADRQILNWRGELNRVCATD